MFQITLNQLDGRIEEQRKFEYKLEILLERFNDTATGIGSMKSLEEMAIYLKKLSRKLEEQIRLAEELTLALNRIKEHYADCEYRILDQVENGKSFGQDANFACIDLPEAEEWSRIFEFVQEDG